MTGPPRRDRGQERRIVGQAQVLTKPEQRTARFAHGRTVAPRRSDTFRGSIIEDRVQFGFHHPGVREPPQGPKREGVPNHVAHQSSSIDWLKTVGVVPVAGTALVTAHQ